MIMAMQKYPSLMFTNPRKCNWRQTNPEKARKFTPMNYLKRTSLGSPRKHMHTHAHTNKQTTQKDDERTQKEQAKEISKLYRKRKAQASLSQKKKKPVWEYHTKECLQLQRDWEREEEAQTSCKKELAGVERHRQRERVASWSSSRHQKQLAGLQSAKRDV